MSTATGIQLASFLLAGMASAQTSLVSVSSTGIPGDNFSIAEDVDSSGRFVTFVSYASNLVPGDTNHATDVFVRDCVTGSTERVSVSSAGSQANSNSLSSSTSWDGRWIVFDSAATNLDPAATNGFLHVYLRDRSSATTTLLDIDAQGSQGDFGAHFPTISADGRWIAFSSGSTNLVPGDTNGLGDIFVRDVQLGITSLASVDSSGVQANAYSMVSGISPDGRHVVFESEATNLVTADTNGSADVFIHDLIGGLTVRASVDSSGAQGNNHSLLLGTTHGGVSDQPHHLISFDGRFVAFTSLATNLVASDTNSRSDVFMFDRLTATTRRVSVASNGDQAVLGGTNSTLSANGRFVAFESESADFVSGDTNNTTDIYCHDTWLGYTTRISVASSGAQGQGWSSSPCIAYDGHRVAFTTQYSLGQPINTPINAYVRDFMSIDPTPIAYCTAKLNSLGCLPAIAATGISNSSATSGFVLSASNFRNGIPGALIFGLNGAAATPFYGGTLCVGGPLIFVAFASSGGSMPPVLDCSGSYSIDMNAYAAGLLGGSPPAALLIPGSVVHLQFWSRDGGFSRPDNVSHSAGLEYVVRS